MNSTNNQDQALTFKTAMKKELEELLIHGGKLSQEFTETRFFSSKEAKDFVFENIVKHFGWQKANILSFFSFPTSSTQHKASLFIEFTLIRKHILKIDFEIDENYSEENIFNGFTLFDKREWFVERRNALEKISISDETLALFIANPYKK